MLNFWVTTITGIPAFIRLFAELARAFIDVLNKNGFAAVPFDGVVQHKIGELLICAPLFSIILLNSSWSGEKIISLIDQTRILMIVGGLLNGLA